jgi:hypothetical protein
VPDDARIPEALEGVRAALERTQAVANQLIGLNLHDANQLAARSGRQLRVVKRDGKGLTVTADLGTNRISMRLKATSSLPPTPAEQLDRPDLMR